jgi:hypothetical protein
MGSTQSLGTLRRLLPTLSNMYALCATRRLALKGTPNGRREIVSRRCFTGRATLWGISMGRLLLGISNPIGAPIGIAKGMPMLCNGHKKTDGSVGMVCVVLTPASLS